MTAAVCRLLVDPPRRGAWNMAVDEVLLESAGAGGPPTLRLYQWAEPTLSLGFFQRDAERAAHAASRGQSVVRRLTGGGAILHDRELTYSLCLPAEHRLALGRERLYGLVHGSIAAALVADGVTAAMSAGERHRDEPFLCFLRRSPGDLVAGGVKVAGSAQRRRRGAVLQHGSIILDRSAAAPEIAGLAPATGLRVDAVELAQRWLPHLGRTLGLDFCRGELSEAERRAAESLVDKYGSAAWNASR